MKSVIYSKRLDEALELVSASKLIRINIKDLSIRQQTKSYYINLLKKIINGFGFEAKGKHLEELKNIRTFMNKKRI